MRGGALAVARRPTSAVCPEGRAVLIRLSWALFGLAFATLGCSRAQRPVVSELPVHPVRGKVLVDGQPPIGAVVRFHAQQPRPVLAPTPRGQVGEDGSFQLTSYRVHDGAPEGEYRVTFTWPDASGEKREDWDEGRQRLPGRYQDPARSGYTARVVVGTNELPPFDLNSYPD